MSHPLHCRCGTIKGFVSNPRNANRGICYCKDCQAFAHFLGQPLEILDERGGSDVIQVLPKDVTIVQGIESLACMRLTPKGLLRWYAACCNTPIGNTLATPKISFIGFVHTCLQSPDQTLDDAFGPVRMWVNTKSAKGHPKPEQKGLGKALRWFIGTVLKARLTGDYRHTPFFRVETDTPIVAPRVLSSAEHASVMQAVRAASG